MTKLPLTNEIDQLLADGKIAEAKATHNRNLDAQLARAKAGETINLTDLMASSEQIHLADTKGGTT